MPPIKQGGDHVGAHHQRALSSGLPAISDRHSTASAPLEGRDRQMNPRERAATMFAFMGSISDVEYAFLFLLNCVCLGASSSERFGNWSSPECAGDVETVVGESQSAEC